MVRGSSPRWSVLGVGEHSKSGTSNADFVGWLGIIIMFSSSSSSSDLRPDQSEEGQFCRLCFTKSAELCPLFPPASIPNKVLLHKIFDCTTITVSPDGVGRICRGWAGVRWANPVGCGSGTDQGISIWERRRRGPTCGEGKIYYNFSVLFVYGPQGESRVASKPVGWRVG